MESSPTTDNTTPPLSRRRSKALESIECLLELGEIRSARVVDPDERWVLFISSDKKGEDKHATCWVHEDAANTHDGLWRFLNRLIAMLREQGFEAQWRPARVEALRRRISSWQWPSARIRS